MRSCGLDIATCTGLAVLDEHGAKGKTIHLPYERGFLRLQLVAQEVKRTLEIWKPGIVMVEGYAYCKSIKSFITLVEVGTVIRAVLHDMHLPWYEVPPTSLKKWTTGKGNAKKEDMALAVKTRWGFESPSDDIVDAMALAQMGQLGYDSLMQIPGIVSSRN